VLVALICIIVGAGDGGSDGVLIFGILELVIGLLIWWFMNNSKVIFGAHNMTFAAGLFAGSVLHNQSGIWLEKMGPGNDAGKGADAFVEDSTEAMYASHGLEYIKNSEPDGQVYTHSSYDFGCIKSGTHKIVFCNKHLDCVQTTGLFAIPAVSRVVRTRFFAKDVRFTHQHKPGRSVQVLIMLMLSGFLFFYLVLDTEGAIGAVLAAIFWWFNIQPWIMFHIGESGKSTTMQTPYSGVPEIQERLDTLVLGHAPSKDVIEKYGGTEGGKKGIEFTLEITQDQIIVTDKVPGFCNLQACSTYDRWICALKDIDYAHAEISSSPIFLYAIAAPRLDTLIQRPARNSA